MAINYTAQINESMQSKSSEELLEIWTMNDRHQWSEQAFEAIAQTLSLRGVGLPEQKMFDPSKDPSIDPKYRGVGGWLGLLCLSLIVIGPITSVANAGNSQLSGTLSADHLDLRLGFFSIQHSCRHRTIKSCAGSC